MGDCILLGMLSLMNLSFLTTPKVLLPLLNHWATSQTPFNLSCPLLSTINKGCSDHHANQFTTFSTDAGVTAAPLTTFGRDQGIERSTNKESNPLTCTIPAEGSSQATCRSSHTIISVVPTATLPNKTICSSSNRAGHTASATKITPTPAIDSQPKENHVSIHIQLILKMESTKREYLKTHQRRRKKKKKRTKQANKR